MSHALSKKLAAGTAEVRFQFDCDGGGPAKGGLGTLFVNGEPEGDSAGAMSLGQRRMHESRPRPIDCRLAVVGRQGDTGLAAWRVRRAGAAPAMPVISA